ncbi:MAG: protein kinase [Elusimicrobiota bacterium]
MFNEQLKTTTYWRFEAFKAAAGRRIELILPAAAFLGMVGWFGRYYLRPPAAPKPALVDIDLVQRLEMPPVRQAEIDAEAVARKNGRELIVNNVGVGLRPFKTSYKRGIGYMPLNTSMKGAKMSRLDESEGFPGLISAAESLRRLKYRGRSLPAPGEPPPPPRRPGNTDTATSIAPMTHKFTAPGPAPQPEKKTGGGIALVPGESGQPAPPAAPPPEEEPAAPERSVPLAVPAALLLLGGGSFMLLRRRRLRAVEPVPEEPVAAEPEAPMADVLAGKYGRLRQLDTAGAVWLVRSVKTQQQFAAKPVRIARALSPRERASMRERAAQVYSLGQPVIVQVHELLESLNPPLVIQEYMLEDTLAQFIDNYRGLGIAAARKILLPVCEALSYGHYYGVPHLNLKPSNIFVLPGGGARVADYRLAAPSSALTVFDAPELAQNKGNALTDVYSLGACLRAMLAGGPGLTSEAQALIAKATSAEPARRHASVLEFQNALDALP